MPELGRECFGNIIESYQPFNSKFYRKKNSKMTFLCGVCEGNPFIYVQFKRYHVTSK